MWVVREGGDIGPGHSRGPYCKVGTDQLGWAMLRAHLISLWLIRSGLVRSPLKFLAGVPFPRRPCFPPRLLTLRQFQGPFPKIQKTRESEA